jgi:regulator of protease activity HflC (stomatin/prohibitin superfamily)
MNPEVYYWLIPSAVILLLIVSSITVVKQGHVAVTTLFGKYNRTLKPGLNFKIPFLESVFRKISLQNQSLEMEFSAITKDQAIVDFKSLLVYTVLNDDEDNIKKVAFKFVDERSFMQTLIRSIEASIRAFVATKKQSEILGMRDEIVLKVKQSVDQHLADWGFHLLDLQINDILFDEAIMRAISQVVVTENLKIAAENEGQAKLITRTREAEGEKQALILKGEGIAQMRKIIGDAMTENLMRLHTLDLDTGPFLLSIWMESMKHIAEHGDGNVIFFDGSIQSMENTMRQMNALDLLKSKGR